MTEYITKEQALYIASYAANTGNLEKMQKLLDAALTDDVVEEVHARWDDIEVHGYLEENGGTKIVYDTFECSRCGCIHLASGEPRWIHCPDCGARMDAETFYCKEGCKR